MVIERGLVKNEEIQDETLQLWGIGLQSLKYGLSNKQMNNRTLFDDDSNSNSSNEP